LKVGWIVCSSLGTQIHIMVQFSEAGLLVSPTWDSLESIVS
jgi:hypothetical protein